MAKYENSFEGVQSGEIRSEEEKPQSIDGKATIEALRANGLDGLADYFEKMSPEKKALLLADLEAAGYNTNQFTTLKPEEGEKAAELIREWDEKGNDLAGRRAVAGEFYDELG